MEFEEFNKKKDYLRQLGIPVPEYYFFIDDEGVYTPKDLAEIFDKNVKRVRGWFSQGLKHGVLPSLDPTRLKVTGLELKKWFYKRDIKRLSKDKRFQQIL